MGSTTLPIPNSHAGGFIQPLKAFNERFQAGPTWQFRILCPLMWQPDAAHRQYSFDRAIRWLTEKLMLVSPMYVAERRE